MANIYSIKSGNASDPTVWSGGVVPASGDRVLINGGFTVELDGDYTWGDASTSTIVINGVSTTASVFVNNGTIRFSRTKSSSLTVRGGLGGASNGKIDLGSEADPIPGAYTATLNLIAGATTNTTQFTSRVFVFSAWGQDKTLYSRPVSVASNSVFTIPTPNNWKVGDWLYFSHAAAPSGGTAMASDVRAIQSIADNGNGTSTITLSAAASNALTQSRYVVNLSRNVVVKASEGNLYGVTLELSSAAGSPDGAHEVGPAEFRMTGMGTTSTAYRGGLSMAQVADSKIAKIQRFVVHNIWSVAGSAVTKVVTGQFGSSGGIVLLGGTAVTKPVVEPVVVLHEMGTGAPPTHRAITTTGGEGRTITRPAIFGCPGILYAEQGSVDLTIDQPLIVGAASLAFSSAGSSATINGGKVVGYSGLFGNLSGSVYNFNPLVCTGVDFVGDANDPTSVAAATSNLFLLISGQNFRAALSNCILPVNTATNRAANLSTMTPRAYIDLLAPNADQGLNYRYARGGRVSREVVERKRGTSSMALASWYSDTPITKSVQFVLGAGQSVPLRGSVKLSPGYGAVMPTVSVTSPVTAPQSITVPATSTSWVDYDLVVTNPAAYAVTFTLTFTALSAANTESAIAYFDGVPDSPFVDTVRHFGYVFDINAYRTADPRITLTEAAALALPVAVDHTAQTITVTGAVTTAEVFQACIADLCQTANLGRAVHITSSDGSDFTTSYTVVGRSNVTGAFTDATGRAVTITAPALIAGSRVQIYDLTTATEIYNGVLAGTGLALATTYVSSHIIRLRAEHSTKLPLETVGVLTSSGLSFLDVQDEDTVYLQAGIDGSTVTEFATDGTNIEVDINDPDGITTVQRLYAWMQHYQTTEEGIRSVFFGALSAIDDVNFVIDQALVNMKLDNVSGIPLRVIGGHLARKDGSTVIATNSGSIQMDPGKAYAISVSGSGGTATVDNAAIAAAVWGNATRTLTVAAGLTSAQEAKIDAIKTKTDNLPTSPADQTTLNQVQTKIDATL